MYRRCKYHEDVANGQGRTTTKTISNIVDTMAIGSSNLILQLCVRPGTDHSSVINLRNSRIGITVATPPISNRTGDRLIGFLNGRFQITGDRIIVRGNRLNHRGRVGVVGPRRVPPRVTTLVG